MSMPTREQWAEFETRADSLYSTQKLDCDGFVLTVRKEITGKNKLGIVIYVNGWVKGEWWGQEKPDCPEQRFMRPSETYAFPQSFRARMLKLLGKRAYAKENYDRKIKVFLPSWTSATSLRRHLVKTCKCITFLDNTHQVPVEESAKTLLGEMEEFLDEHRG